MSNKQSVHAIVGNGTAPTKVLLEGLRDAVRNKDQVSVIWQGPPGETLEDVYDFIMDNEISFTMFYADGVTPARVFRESEHGVVQKVRDPFKSAIQSVENDGKVLYLWDEDAPDEQVEPVFDLIERGTLVLDLTNGLGPISIEMDIPEPVEPEIAKDADEPDEDTTFTKEELEAATSFTVKRYGERLGCAAKTKSGIIAELFPDDELTASTEEGEGEVEPSPTAVGAAEAPSSSTTAPAPLLDDQFEEALASFQKSLTDLFRLLYRS